MDTKHTCVKENKVKRNGVKTNYKATMRNHLRSKK